MSDEYILNAGESKHDNPADTSASMTGSIEEFLSGLANLCENVQKKPNHNKKSPGHNLEKYELWLEQAYEMLGELSNETVALLYASEWVLDNFHIIRQTMVQIEESIPNSYYLQLPKLEDEPFAGYSRIHTIAHVLLSHQNLLLDNNDLQDLLISFQQQVPLTMGELWAFPTFLRYSLIESLAHILVSMLQPEKEPNLPETMPAFPDGYADVAEKEGHEDTNNQDNLANIILSLRTINEENWNDFFEAVSIVEKTLQEDPAGIYPKMDFDTRDLYRKEIENLSNSSNLDEYEVAESLLKAARSHVTDELPTNAPIVTLDAVGREAHSSSHDTTRHVLHERATHIGEYLIGESRPNFEEEIGYRVDYKTASRRWLKHHPSFLYFFSLFVVTAVIIFLFGLSFISAELFGGGAFSFLNLTTGSVFSPSTNTVQWIFFGLLGVLLLVPLFTIVVGLVNWWIALIIPPRTLPKLNFEDGIPAPHQALVAIPTIVGRRSDIDSLTYQLELHYLRNPEAGLSFAILSDFPDADSESLPEDQALIQYAISAVEALNAKYENGIEENGTSDSTMFQPEKTTSKRFFFIHRKRLWNPSEKKWMGWERKRGKLQELNALLRGGKRHSFINVDDSLEVLHQVRYVITLDTDTILPHGAAWRLAGTMAHPLNQAVFDPESGQVISGYTVLQPRIEIHPKSSGVSRFTQLYAGDAGLDLYTLAVSDSYQDLFSEGIYVGKGIYEIDSFQNSIENRIPENSVLSHDLLEGIMGRAGLVTDITLIEDYPQNYFIQTIRQRRWIRGDWQLLPFLLTTNRTGQVFSLIDRWKIFDNLRRSLLMPTLLLIFSIGLLFFPTLAPFLTVIIFLSLGIPIFTSLAHSGIRILRGQSPGFFLRPWGWTILRWLTAVAFVPYEAYISIDAILTTLWRLVVSHRNLLQWTTAAQTARIFGLHKRSQIIWRKLGVSSILALSAATGLILIDRLTYEELAYVSPVLILWAISPFILWWLDRKIIDRIAPLNNEQEKFLRQISRYTWGYFERFVGPEDHWLPPDHFQETPLGVIAHRTSPTNIGMLLTSTLAAYDLGFLDHLGLATRLVNTIETFDKIELYRGHFLNWYDTQTLQPLNPRYVSTVDSGNLAASLLVITQASKSIPDQPIFRWDLWQGYLDTLSNLSEILKAIQKEEFEHQVEQLVKIISSVHDEILSLRLQSESWYPLFVKVSGEVWENISSLLMELLEVGHSAFDYKTMDILEEITGQIERQHSSVSQTIAELVPWIPLLEHPPVAFESTEWQESIHLLRENLPYNLSLTQVERYVKATIPHINALFYLHKERNSSDPLTEESTSDNAKDPDQAALDWLNSLDNALSYAASNAKMLLEKYHYIAERTEAYVNEMDFTFLYNKKRRVFHIGLNLEVGELDKNFYDLLASEARIASVIAIAKGEVPRSHWLQMGRPITPIKGASVLLSWSGTMFEYLMPPLFLRSYSGTLLGESSKGVVSHQINYGKKKGIPWGISESGFYQFDSNQNYQYRAFGVPSLGFKRGLGDDSVIAPYASLLAIKWDPHAVIRNLFDLSRYDMLGLFGYYEALDFTSNRLLLNQTHAVVAEYMAHHQGMILMALVNYLQKDIMVHRMHSDPRIQGVELLLQERIPQPSPLEDLNKEGVQRTQKPSTAPEEIYPWQVPVRTPIPQVSLLSNGSYKVFMTNSGSGYSSWHDIDLTRWQADGVTDPWGCWIYIQNLEGSSQIGNRLWSASHQPIPGDPENMQVTFFAHMVVYRRTENQIASTMEVTVAPEDPVEIRRLHLLNNSDQRRLLRITSYGEVILSPQAGDNRHPAFNKLFIECEFVAALNLQIFTRRLRDNEEESIWLGHMVVSPENQKTAQHEVDRHHFIGRHHSHKNPAALLSEEELRNSNDATLDPIFALGDIVDIEAHQTEDMAYLTFTAKSREGIIALAEQYHNWSVIEHTFHQADLTSQASMGRHEITTPILKNIRQVLSAFLYPFKMIRTSTETISENRMSQSGLWRFGISGDYPILLVEIEDPYHVKVVSEALQIHKFLRSRGFLVDVVILNRQQSNYGGELNGVLHRLVNRRKSDGWVNQRGGIYFLNQDQMKPEELALVRTAARVLVTAEKGALGDQLPGYSMMVHHLPGLPAMRQAHLTEDTPPSYEDTPIDQEGDRLFFNGFGAFGADGREYVIDLVDGKSTPAPWVNVIGYPEFGFMVSESGSQCTWAVNSGENRLTPWSNDPVQDPTGEALYLRDEETGEFWTPTPLPAGSREPYRVAHGAGYTTFEHNSHGLHQKMTVFASPEDPVKIIHLKIKNSLQRPRRVTATQYVEWVLGTIPSASMPFIIPEYDPALECLLAMNPYHNEFGGRVAFLAASKPVHGLTADRAEFVGRNGSLANPTALHRLGLETRISAGEDPCAVLQVHLDLLPGDTEEIYFVLGQGSDKSHALDLIEKYKDAAYVSAAFERTHVFWDRLLETIQVQTPEPALDVMMNRWLLYQSLSCRIWGRSGFYQSSGAFGFRDQLQDVLALQAIDPTITRGQILNAANHQFEEGDVLHWWHPPSGRGVRTRISDDLLWLPYVTAMYIQTTGDHQILDEEIPFLTAPILDADDDEHYGHFPRTNQLFSLLEHCLRAIEKGATAGRHALPLIGGGDWNDGFNRVGAGGEGESIWMAWFLYDVLTRFAVILEQRGDRQQAEDYRARAKAYADAVEKSGWDGGWYRRGYYDSGSPLGSKTSTECQIDALAQSWSVLSGAGDPQRSRQAMQAVFDRLVRPEDRLILLFTPPFDKTRHNPGYIKGYQPGIRENGGQYTHAAAWTAWAFAALGDGKKAGELFDLLNPIYQTDTAEKASVYRVEPYAICADIYSTSPFVGRGGWTWYTGSASWIYRLGLEAILGFKKVGSNLFIDPVIPPDWDGFEIAYRFGDSIYRIQVHNPDHVSRQVKQVVLDDCILNDKLIPLVDDQNEHQVIVTMGEAHPDNES